MVNGRKRVPRRFESRKYMKKGNALRLAPSPPFLVQSELQGQLVTNITSLCVCVCVLCACVRACVCVCERESERDKLGRMFGIQNIS